MKGLSTKISKTLVPGSTLVCADNSGANVLSIINKIGGKGIKGRLSHAGIGDMVSVSVKVGNLAHMKKIERAMIIRQKQAIRRANGLRVKFEDNAAILINDANLPIATEIKGPVAREVIERNIKIATIASKVV